MRRTGLILVSLVAALGCDNIDYINIDPDHVTLRTRNDSAWLHALGKSQTGHEYPKAKMTWSSKDESVAKVDHTGKVVPVKSGLTEVVVQHGKVTASVPVEVLFAEKIAVEPKNMTLVQGEDGQEFTVKVYDYKGRELKDRTATFQVKDQKIVSMGGGNKAFPLDPGETTIDVRVEDKTESVTVKVEAEAQAKK